MCKIGSSGSRYTKRGSSEGTRGVGVRVRTCARLCVPEGRGSWGARCTSAERAPHGRGRRGYTGRVEGSQQVRCAKAQGADPRLSQSPAGRPRPHPLPLRRCRRPTSPPESLLAAGAEPAPTPIAARRRRVAASSQTWASSRTTRRTALARATEHSKHQGRAPWGRSQAVCGALDHGRDQGAQRRIVRSRPGAWMWGASCPWGLSSRPPSNTSVSSPGISPTVWRSPV